MVAGRYPPAACCRLKGRFSERPLLFLGRSVASQSICRRLQSVLRRPKGHAFQVAQSRRPRQTGAPAGMYSRPSELLHRPSVRSIESGRVGPATCIFESTQDLAPSQSPVWKLSRQDGLAAAHEPARRRSTNRHPDTGKAASRQSPGRRLTDSARGQLPNPYSRKEETAKEKPNTP